MDIAGPLLRTSSRNKVEVQRQLLQKKFIIITVLVLTVRSSFGEDLNELQDINIDGSVNCYEKSNCPLSSKDTSPSEDSKYTSTLENVNDISLHNEKSDTVIDSPLLDEYDQSELSLLEQDDKQPSTTEGDAGSQEYCEKTAEVSTDNCQQQASPITTIAQGDQESIEQDEVKCEFVEENINNCYKIQNENSEGETRAEVSREKTLIADSTGRETDQVELDPELENVPLREILLKLKPEGLTDDEDEQSPDYSVSQTNMEEDIEVEEEVLVSSGSADKQELTLDDNISSSSNSSNGGSDSSSGGSNSNSGGSKKAVCLELNMTDPITDVEIINATTLMKILAVDLNVTSRASAGPCYLIYFFSPYCPFSVMGSAYVNALARSLPNIPVYGLDSIEHHSVNARYGVMGTPTLLLFHNGNGVGRYNASEYSVSQLLSFIRHYTDQEIININVTSLDFRASLPTQVAEGRPYALWAAWTFLISFASWLFMTSELCARLTEAVLNNWREAEAQNDHQD
ncbi:thioredoxin domain-containing protein 15 [Procambarus clarkii]|uniref:thioredoxin domain-containing protein 15 n=1 Tax=Procambarus clarkii TaxID=6728 RepID=UPI001E6751C7|nr:thioredoxin domain-containing protein 15-like [Procambarus clarkii]